MTQEHSYRNYWIRLGEVTNLLLLAQWQPGGLLRLGNLLTTGRILKYTYECKIIDQFRYIKIPLKQQISARGSGG